MRLTEKMAVPRRLEYRSWLLLILLGWLSLVLLISICVYDFMDAVNKKTREKALVSMCDQRSRVLQDRFSVCVNDVRALSILISTFHYFMNSSAIDQETFAEYAWRTAFQRPLLSGVAYAERVMNSDRKHGWTINTLVRDDDDPVVFSQETIPYTVFLDTVSGEEYVENLQTAKTTGRAVLTHPFRLPNSRHLGVILTVPVYMKKLGPNPSVLERTEATAGYLGGAFDVESLVVHVLRQLSGTQEILVNVYDVTDDSDRLLMYGDPERGGDNSLFYISAVEFGDPTRRHQIECRYLFTAPVPWTALGSALFVFVVSSLVGLILLRNYSS